MITSFRSVWATTLHTLQVSLTCRWKPYIVSSSIVLENARLSPEVFDSNVVTDEADVDVQSGLNCVNIYHFSNESKTLTFRYKCDACGSSAFTMPGNTMLKSGTTENVQEIWNAL